jgi:CheY-like chemotaxis protein
VVEDAPAIAALLAALLAGAGHRVTVSAGGDAVAVARADPPVLVLLDLLLPGSDGTEVCRRLRGAPRTWGAAIVVTATPPDLLPARLAGCQYEALIRKPFTVRDILGAVARLLAA